MATPPVDLDLRLVHSFAVVARHRHFGRAAEELHTTQPSLSRQVRRLEQQVGARLLDRSARGTELTEAGKVFLPLARTLLDSADNAMSHTRAAAQPTRLTVGYATNIVITPVVAEMRGLHPEVDVRTRHLLWNRPRAALLDREVDVAVTRLPLSADGLRVSVLHDEPRVLLVSVGHRLAGKESVTLDDIAHEPLPRLPDPAWNAFWRVDPRPDGRPAPDGPLVEDVEDKTELIAAGLAVAIVPAGDYLDRVRPDITTIPLDGVEPGHVVIATREGDHNRLVPAFRKLAERHLGNRPRPVARRTQES